MWWACLSFVVHALVRVVGVVVCCQLAARLDVCVHFALQLESEIINTQQNRQDLQQQCQDLSKVRREGGRKGGRREGGRKGGSLDSVCVGLGEARVEGEVGSL